jgi:hypothetical protein
MGKYKVDGIFVVMFGHGWSIKKEKGINVEFSGNLDVVDLLDRVTEEITKWLKEEAKQKP